MIHHAIVTLLSTLPYVLADGYPKQTPSVPFDSGAASAGAAGYPPLSMDYESRYRGPVAMLMVLPDGHIAETAEVTAARASHLAALNKAKVLWSAAGSAGTGSGAQSYLPPQSSPSSTGSSSHKQGSSSATAVENKPYNGPLAMPMVLPDGHIADTAEVAAARTAHLAAVEKAATQHAASAGGSEGYSYPQPGTNSLEAPMGSGPNAVQGQSGSLSGSEGYSYTKPGSNSLDAVSSGGHMGTGINAIQGQAGSLSGSEGYNYPNPESNSLEAGSSGKQSYLPPQPGVAGSSIQAGSSATSSGNTPYTGPQAMLMVLPSGYVADTPDNAALKAAHLSALLKAQAAWKPQHK